MTAFDIASESREADFATAATMMQPRRAAITRLHLADFRNHVYRVFELDQRPVVLTGSNGVGKTSVLEAISLLCPGRGLRAASMDDIARHGGHGGWTVAAHLHCGNSDHAIGTEWPIAEMRATQRTRRFRIDGSTPTTASAMTTIIRPIWLTPAMDSLFIGLPGERRRFLDRLVGLGDSSHLERCTAFERGVRERNALLKDSGAAASRWLDAIENEIAAHATAIAAARRVFVRKLAACAKHDAEPTIVPEPVLSLAGRLEQSLDSMAAVDVEEEYRTVLATSRSEDARSGRTNEGPHKTDFIVSMAGDGRPARQCSSGEQKALLISLILAVTRLFTHSLGRTTPILLLDEIAAHLDAPRCHALFNRIAALGIQFWATGVAKSVASLLDEQAQYLRLTSAQTQS